MTTTQWLFEYHILQEKEKQESELTVATIKTCRKVLANLLGLDLMQDDDEDVYMPLIMMVARREVIESILEKFEKDKLTSEALDDDNFEQLSNAMANDELGDMEPIMPDLEKIEKADLERKMRAVGIKFVDKLPDVPHITLNKKKEKPKASIKFKDND